MPTTIHTAYTTAVNPASTTPVITRRQLWSGLARKVLHAEDFIPHFTSCQLLSESTSPSGDKILTRRAIIKDGAMPHIKSRYIDEVCTLFAPTKVDFQSETQLTQNIISDGPGMGDQDLQLTYIFDWTYPEVEAGSEEEGQKVEEQREGGKKAVEMTLKGIRGMVEKGGL